MESPDTLVDWLSSAYQVTSYKFSFSGPNFRDVEEDIQRPLSRIANILRGERNEALVENRRNGLEKDVIVELTRKLMATGESISAKRLASESAESEEEFTTSGTSMKIDVESLEGSQSQQEAVDRVREIYRRLRGEE